MNLLDCFWKRNSMLRQAEKLFFYLKGIYSEEKLAWSIHWHEVNCEFFAHVAILESVLTYALPTHLAVC